MSSNSRSQQQHSAMSAGDLDLFYLRDLPGMLADHGHLSRLDELLTNFDYLQAKVSRLGPEPVVADFERAQRAEREQKSGSLSTDVIEIGRAIQLSAYILSQDRLQLAQQLLARLPSPFAQRCLTPVIQARLEQPWLRPLRDTLNGPSKSLRRTIVAHQVPVTAVAIAPDGRSVLSGAADSTLRFWDCQQGTRIYELGGHAAPITAVAISPDGGIGASASEDMTVRVWDLSRGELCHVFRRHQLPVTALAITADNNSALSSAAQLDQQADTPIIVWDLKSGTIQQELAGHRNLV